MCAHQDTHDDYTLDGASGITVSLDFGRKDWDVTAIVKAWMGQGQPNYGFFMKDNNEWIPDFGGGQFSSRQGPSAIYWPILRINWKPSSSDTPVGGFYDPSNKLAVLAPCFVIGVLLAAISTVYTFKKKGKD